MPARGSPAPWPTVSSRASWRRTLVLQPPGGAGGIPPPWQRIGGFEVPLLPTVVAAGGMSDVSDIGPDVSGILGEGISDEKPMKRPGLEVL